jgi:trigger factor
MSEHEHPHPSFSVSATERSPVLRALQVEVEERDVKHAFEQVYRNLAKSVRVRGFRPGKTPRAVLEKLYSATVAEEVERLLVNETFAAAVERSGIVPVVEPSIDAEPPKPGQTFRYTAEVEVKPSVELPALDGLPATRPAVRVGEDEVESELEGLRLRRAPLESEPEGARAGDGTVLSMSYQGRIGGEPFEGGSAEGAQVEIGAGRLVPGFEDGLRGAVRGEEREVRVTFPDDYPAAELRGKEAVFAVQVHELQRRKLPALDDAFAKELGEEGLDTLEGLRARLREGITARREHAAQETLRRSLLDALIARTAFEVPPGLVERRLAQRLSNAHDQLHEVMPHDELHARLDEWRVTWRPDAEREVRESLLLEAVAEQQGFEASDDEVQARIDAIAREQGIAPARLAALYEQRGATPGLRVRIREEKALEFLTSRAKVDETSGT